MIAILGTGRMGGALGTSLVAAGHEIIFGSRAPERADVQHLVATLGGRAKAGSIEDAAALADCLVIATPYSAMQALLDELGDVSGKIVIDVTNALAMSDDGLMTMASNTSAGEELQAALPDTKVVKALNTVGFHILANPAVAGGPVSALLAGNDAKAKQTVSELVQSLGFEVVDLGPIRQARYMEGMSALYLTPYLQGRIGDAFEYHLRGGAAPKKSQGVRAAG